MVNFSICLVYFYLLLVVFPSWFLPEMSGGIPRDPEELSRWLKRETNLRYDIRKLLRGKQFSLSFITENVSQPGAFTTILGG